MNKMRSALSDQQLLSAYLSGDKNAISILIERHAKRVRDYIRMMVKNNEIADDIYQETFIKVVKFINEGRYKDNGKFLSWVLRIAHNQAIDHFRQMKQQNNISETDAGYDILNAKKFADMLKDEQFSSVQKAFNKLIHRIEIDNDWVETIINFNVLLDSHYPIVATVIEKRDYIARPENHFKRSLVFSTLTIRL